MARPKKPARGQQGGNGRAGNSAERRTADRRLFTQDYLRALPTTGKLYFVHDSLEPGLCLGVTPAGKKAYYVRKKIAGNSERIWLGPFPYLKLKAARKKATVTKGLIAEGKNPSEERRRRRTELTVGELLEDYIVKHLKAKRRPKAEVSARQLMRDYLEPLLALRLSDLTRARVVRLHAENSDKRKPRANRAIEVLSAACRWAIRHDLAPTVWNGASPCFGIERNPETKRDRFLSPDEVGRFLMALESEPADISDFFKLLLFTGARRANVQAMKWADLDLDGGTWTINASEAKAGEAITVALIPQAVVILTRRRAELQRPARPTSRLAGESSRAAAWRRKLEAQRRKNGEIYVFPSWGRKSGHLVEPRQPWERVCKRAGISCGKGVENGVVVHDLRRTTGSWLAAQGVSLPLIGRVLGHKSVAATQVYARLNVEAIRPALEQFGANLGKALEKAKADAAKKSADEVVH